MGFTVGLNKVLNSKITSAALFTVAGTGKVIYDYKNAPQKEKKDVLIRESTILMSSALGMFLYSSAKNTISTSKFIQKSTNYIKNGIKKGLNKLISPQKSNASNKRICTILRNGAEILQNCADNILLLGAGLFGGIAADELIESKYIRKIQKKYDKSKSVVEQKMKETSANSTVVTNENNDINKIVEHRSKAQVKKLNRFDDFKKKIAESDFQNNLHIDSDTSKNIVSNISNIPEMKILSTTMIGLQTLQIAEEKTFRAKMKKMTHGLMTNTLLPLFFMSTATVLTKNTKALYRIPIVLGSMVAGPVLTNFIDTNRSNHKQLKEAENSEEKTEIKQAKEEEKTQEVQTENTNVV